MAYPLQQNSLSDPRALKRRARLIPSMEYELGGNADGQKHQSLGYYHGVVFIVARHQEVHIDMHGATSSGMSQPTMRSAHEAP